MIEANSCVLIESDWNLKEGKKGIWRKDFGGINRIRLEFKMK